MDKSQALNMMEKWYAKNYVCYEIRFNDMDEREFCAIAPKHFKKDQLCRAVRHNTLISPEGLKVFLKDVFRVWQEQNVFNLYRSMAKYEGGLPRMNKVLGYRKQETEDWMKIKNSRIKSYDCLIDVDSPNHACMKETKEDAIKIHDLLVNYNVPHTFTFTGKGYHLIIPDDVFKKYSLSLDPERDDCKNIYGFYNFINRRLHNTISELVDTGLNDSMRVAKSPYSLSFYPDSVFVCWPMNSEHEIQNHEFWHYQLDEKCYLKGGYKDMFRRGVHNFHHDWRPTDIDGFLNEINASELEWQQTLQ